MTIGSLACDDDGLWQVNLEDVNVTVLTNGSDWACAFADISTKGVINPPLPPECSKSGWPQQEGEGEQ